MKRKRLFFAGLFTTAILLLASSPAGCPNKSKMMGIASNNLTVYWIDTEGGAATLIVTPAGESILIDAGNPGGRDSERIYEVAHNVAGLQQIDHLVITHWHNDHFGGAALLAAKMPVIEVIDKGIADSLLQDKNFADNIQAYKDMPVKQRSLLRPGAFITLKSLPKGFQKLSLQLVGADKHFVPVAKTFAVVNGCDTVREKAIDKSDNANSQVLVMDYGSFRFFLSLTANNPKMV